MSNGFSALVFVFVLALLGQGEDQVTELSYMRGIFPLAVPTAVLTIVLLFLLLLLLRYCSCCFGFVAAAAFVVSAAAVTSAAVVIVVAAVTFFAAVAVALVTVATASVVAACFTATSAAVHKHNRFHSKKKFEFSACGSLCFDVWSYKNLRTFVRFCK